jgi:hypothetical protein
MRASKSSGSSPTSDLFVLAAVVVLLAAISFSAATWVHGRGYTLYYGDAEAHLNIARRVVDSRTPGPEQLGTVWLPLPHIAMLPFIVNDSDWRSGLAGVYPSAIAFVIAGTTLFFAARRAFQSLLAASASLVVFALNPNLLYLQSTPMTEAMFFAGLCGLLWATLWFRESQSLLALLFGGAFANVASLTRYEGWFLLPFVFLYVLLAAERKWLALLFGAIAAIGPLSWLAHNQYYYSNALEFYNGPYSAVAIYHRQLAGGMQPYPGDHNWIAAFHYYAEASHLVAGLPVMILGGLGALAAFARKVLWPILLLALAPLFYLWSLHSSGTPIFVPTLWPFSWYNTRYAVAIIPLLAFATGALLTFLSKRWQVLTPLAIALGLIGFYISRDPVSICWKESEVNSETRRSWTRSAAEYLKANYRPASGVAISFGDLTGILREAGIPLKQSLHEGNHPAWDAAMASPERFLREEWAVAFAGDDLASAIVKADRTNGVHFELRERISMKDAPAVEIYHRETGLDQEPGLDHKR